MESHPLKFWVTFPIPYHLNPIEPEPFYLSTLYLSLYLKISIETVANLFTSIWISTALLLNILFTLSIALSSPLSLRAISIISGSFMGYISTAIALLERGYTPYRDLLPFLS